MEDRLFGKVAWFNDERGYGFINPVNEDDEPVAAVEYFVHYSSVEMKGFKSLKADQRVSFELMETPRGTQAVKVVPE